MPPGYDGGMAAINAALMWKTPLASPYQLQIHKCEITQAPSQTRITKINGHIMHQMAAKPIFYLPRESAVGVVDSKTQCGR